MKTYSDFTTLVSAEREPRKNFGTLISCVLPRPIAFVSSISTDGVANLAPFSFFNAVGASPPTLIFCPGTSRTGKEKDTLRNVRDQGEFVVNVVPHAIREEMNDTAYPFPSDVSEFEAVGFTMLPSRFIKPPRVAQSPVQMECKLVQIVTIGSGPLSSNICIGEVLCFHVASEDLLADETVDVEKLDLVGRLGAKEYSTTRDRFEMGQPTTEPTPRSHAE